MSRRASRRMAAAVPVLLEVVAADVAGGGSVEGALRRTAADDGPLAPGLAALVAAMDTGGSLVAALEGWAERCPEVLVAVGALRVAHEGGSPPAGPLVALADALTDHGDALAEARAAAAQSRVSAVVVGVAPLASLALAGSVDPRVLGALTGTSAGRACLVVGAALNGLAALSMRHLFRAATR